MTMQRRGLLVLLLGLPVFDATAGDATGASDCWNRFAAAVERHEADAKAADDAYDRALRLGGGPALQRQWAVVGAMQRQAQASQGRVDALDRRCSKLGARAAGRASASAPAGAGSLADQIPPNHGGI